MSYVDGFVLNVKKDKLEDYRKMAEIASKVWMDHGAIAYHETVLDDPKAEFGISFNELSKPTADEIVVFAYIVYKSREDRDRINPKVMEDERLKNSCDPNNMPFDCSRMAYGGFKSLVSA